MRLHLQPVSVRIIHMSEILQCQIWNTWIDQEANKVMGDEKLISTPDSKVKVFVVPTNEELAIARETVALV
jgi:acetate kinase